MAPRRPAAVRFLVLIAIVAAAALADGQAAAAAAAAHGATGALRDAGPRVEALQLLLQQPRMNLLQEAAAQAGGPTPAEVAAPPARRGATRAEAPGQGVEQQQQEAVLARQQQPDPAQKLEQSQEAEAPPDQQQGPAAEPGTPEGPAAPTLVAAAAPASAPDDAALASSATGASAEVAGTMATSAAPLKNPRGAVVKGRAKDAGVAPPKDLSEQTSDSQQQQQPAPAEARSASTVPASPAQEQALAEAPASSNPDGVVQAAPGGASTSDHPLAAITGASAAAVASADRAVDATEGKEGQAGGEANSASQPPSKGEPGAADATAAGPGVAHATPQVAAGAQDVQTLQAAAAADLGPDAGARGRSGSNAAATTEAGAAVGGDSGGGGRGGGNGREEAVGGNGTDPQEQLEALSLGPDAAAKDGAEEDEQGEGLLDARSAHDDEELPPARAYHPHARDSGGAAEPHNEGWHDGGGGTTAGAQPGVPAEPVGSEALPQQGEVGQRAVGGADGAAVAAEPAPAGTPDLSAAAAADAAAAGTDPPRAIRDGVAGSVGLLCAALGAVVAAILRRSHARPHAMLRGAIDVLFRGSGVAASPRKRYSSGYGSGGSPQLLNSGVSFGGDAGGGGLKRSGSWDNW
jgi:hypothetical protein